MAKCMWAKNKSPGSTTNIVFQAWVLEVDETLCSEKLFQLKMNTTAQLPFHSLALLYFNLVSTGFKVRLLSLCKSTCWVRFLTPKIYNWCSELALGSVVLWGICWDETNSKCFCNGWILFAVEQAPGSIFQSWGQCSSYRSTSCDPVFLWFWRAWHLEKLGFQEPEMYIQWCSYKDPSQGLIGCACILTCTNCSQTSTSFLPSGRF